MSDLAYIDGFKSPQPLPDIRVELRPVRGYGHSLAVLVNGVAVGWIGTDELGYSSAKDWILLTGYSVKGEAP